jgi:two-component system LytT family sensor kinase
MTTTRRERWAEYVNKHYKLFLVPVVFGFHKLFFFLTDPYAEPLRSRTLLENTVQNIGLILFSFIIIHGSVRITNRLNERLPWATTPALRVLVQIFAQLMLSTVWIMIYQFIVVLALYNVNMFTLIGSPEFTPEIRFVMWRFFFASAMVSLFASLIITGRNFRMQNAELKIQAAQLREVAAQAELQALKLQLDPHFVFNNFSTLSALIEEDKNLAQLFVENLSRVYRYMIQNIHSDTITLHKEVKFIESYIYLISIRHSDNVKVTVNIPEEFFQKRIPPITLQLLIENAIKHNIASAAQPLTITIAIADNQLRVSNNLQRISIPPHTSSRIGLENIKSRYRIVSGKEPVVDETTDAFTVKLPLLD